MNTEKENWHWYILHCKAGQEERAKDNVENQGYSTCLPQIKRQKILRGKKTTALKPCSPAICSCT